SVAKRSGMSVGKHSVQTDDSDDRDRDHPNERFLAPSFHRTSIAAHTSTVINSFWREGWSLIAVPLSPHSPTPLIAALCPQICLAHSERFLSTCCECITVRLIWAVHIIGEDHRRHIYACESCQNHRQFGLTADFTVDPRVRPMLQCMRCRLMTRHSYVRSDWLPANVVTIARPISQLSHSASVQQPSGGCSENLLQFPRFPSRKIIELQPTS